MVTIPDRLTHISVAALVVAAFAASAYAAAPLPPTNVIVGITVDEAGPSAVTSADAAAVGWSDIKDCTCEKRGQFLAGLERMEAKVNAEFNELTVQRSAMKNPTKAKELDQALTELGNTQLFLKTISEQLSRTSLQTWEQMKAKVGLAWTKSQEAYARAQVHTTG